MKVLTLAVAVGLALLFQTTVIGFIFSQTPDIDLVLIVGWKFCWVIPGFTGK